ncbi:hypothetical protein [Lysobacter sp. Root983]|uniref:hypothetical protein n=1 Tax=Lysobacter sp. Root983 TaxID=1736613 RepID=UPI0012FC20ED|nr:hypothetical protein [Lysobacter sp. Root983]
MSVTVGVAAVAADAADAADAAIAAIAADAAVAAVAAAAAIAAIAADAADAADAPDAPMSPLLSPLPLPFPPLEKGGRGDLLHPTQTHKPSIPRFAQTGQNAPIAPQPQRHGRPR